jgi:hypothetical protein
MAEKPGVIPHAVAPASAAEERAAVAAGINPIVNQCFVMFPGTGKI